MKTYLVVQPQNIFLGHIHNRAIVAIKRIGMRDDRVQVVIAACELQNDYYRFFCLGCDVGSPLLLLPGVLVAPRRFVDFYANWYSLSDTIN